MNKFFRLIPRDNLLKDSFVADAWDLKGSDPSGFCRGRSISNWPRGISFLASTPEMEGDLDDFVVNDADVPLVTMRLINLIKTLNVPEFQVLPAEAVWSSGRREPVAVLNFTGLVAGLDMSRTRIERYPQNYPNPKKRNKIWVVMAPVLIQQAVSAWDLFRCEAYPDHLFASSKFRELFASNGMTGVGFDLVKLS